MGTYKRADLSRVKKVRLDKRKSLSSLRSFAKIPETRGARNFVDTLPGFLKAAEFKSLLADLDKARRKSRPIVWMMGAHVIKVGLSPLLIDLMNFDFVTGLAFNGAGLIHDLELAFTGQTSEDVPAGLVGGSFGMSRETARWYAEIVRRADTEDMGLGEAAGAYLLDKKARYRRFSLLAQAAKANIPATIHVAVDTDIVCQHPEYDAAATARASHIDFQILAEIVARGDRGGVFLNVGSAVILPEVFLKALTVARNLYGRPHNIVTANFDMLRHYRPEVNVVDRPTRGGGKGYWFTGHHELMIPLLAWGAKAEAKRKRTKT